MIIRKEVQLTLKASSLNNRRSERRVGERSSGMGLPLHNRKNYKLWEHHIERPTSET